MKIKYFIYYLLFTMKNIRALPSLVSVIILTITGVIAQEFTIPYSYHYDQALDLSPFRILVGLSLDDCRTECQERFRCLSFNFKANICELNEERETASIFLKDLPGSVYQEKTLGPRPNFLQCGTSMCGINEVCDYKTSSCSIKECEAFSPPQNGEVLGNDFAVGRRIRTGCKQGFVSSTGSLSMQTSTCLQNGSWDITPFHCIELTTPAPTTPLPTTPMTTSPTATSSITPPLTSTTVTTTPVITTLVKTTTTATTPVTSPPQIIEQWVSTVTGFSSQYDNGWFSAAQVIGPPNVYPQYGDLEQTWTPEILDANQFIEIQFTESVQVINLTIYETNHAGAVKSIKAMDGAGNWVQLWSTPTVQNIQSSRMFTPVMSVFPTSTRDFRIEIDCTLSNSWVEIDAVKLVGTK